MTSNPMAQTTMYEKAGIVSDKPMTISGTINKTALLLIIVALTSVYTWYLAMTGFADKVKIFTYGGLFAGLALAFTLYFNPAKARLLSITYAVCQGLVLGGVSAMAESQFHGIVIQAVGLTFISMFSMLFLYRIGAIKATPTFTKVVITSTFAIFVFYLVSIVLSFIKPGFTSFLFMGPLGIVISLFFIAMANLNFILDFNFIEKGAQGYAPKYFEWYGAFALMVTLIWLYLEMLRLLSILRNR